MPDSPPQTNISVPVHTALWPARADGAPVALIVRQVFVVGSYAMPSPSTPPVETPPHTIISVPVQTAVWS